MSIQIGHTSKLVIYFQIVIQFRKSFDSICLNIITKTPKSQTMSYVFEKQSKSEAETFSFDSQPSSNAELVISFASDPEDMFQIFEEISKEIGFQMIEKEHTHCTAIKRPKPKSSMLNVINCFGWWQKQNVTAIKLHICWSGGKHGVGQKKVGYLKGLIGSSMQASAFLDLFRRRVSGMVKSEGSQIFLMSEGEQISTESDPFLIEASSSHLINQILINQEYELCHSANKMLTDFQSNFKNLPESLALLPLPMKNAISIVNQIHSSLQLINLRIPQELQIYSRISIEKYLFDKLQNSLFSIYRLKNIEIGRAFQEKRQSILHKYTIREIFEEVSLNKKFWNINQKRMNQFASFKQAKDCIYFLSASRELEKIVFTTNPREKVKFCQLLYTELKTHFYDYSKGKYQLSSMEDIIPVMIIVVLFSKVSDLRSEFDLMTDFIAYDPNQMESEKRLLINLSESYNYIVRDWLIKK